MRTLALVSLVLLASGCSLIFNPNDHTELYGRDAAVDGGNMEVDGGSDAAQDAGQDASSDGGVDPLCEPAPSFDPPAWRDCTSEPCRCVFGFHNQNVTPGDTTARFEDALSIAWPSGNDFSIGYVVTNPNGSWARVQTFDPYLVPTSAPRIEYLSPSGVRDVAVGAVDEEHVGVVLLSDPVDDRSGVWVGTLPSLARDPLTPLTGSSTGPFGRPAVLGGGFDAEARAPRFVWRIQNDAEMSLGSIDAFDFDATNYGQHAGPSVPTAESTVPMSGSRGELVSYEDGETGVALWSGHDGGPYRLPTPERMGRPALAYRGKGIYVVAYPVETGLRFEQLRCEVRPCDSSDAECASVHCCPLSARVVPTVYRHHPAVDSLEDGTVIAAALDEARQYSAAVLLDHELNPIPLNGVSAQDPVPDAFFFRVNYAREALGDLAVAARTFDGRMQVALVAAEYLPTDVLIGRPSLVQVRTLDGCVH